MQSSAGILGGIRWVILSGLLLICFQSTRELPGLYPDPQILAQQREEQTKQGAARQKRQVLKRSA